MTFWIVILNNQPKARMISLLQKRLNTRLHINGAYLHKKINLL